MEVRKDLIVKRFNQECPVGTEVTYWTGIAGDGPGKKSKTSCEAYVLSGHTPVVHLEDVRGCIALTHIKIEEVPNVVRSTK